MKKIMMFIAFSCFLSVIFADLTLESQQDSVKKYSTITGNVKNRSGRAVRNVSIAIKGERNFSAKTNQQGDFVLKKIPLGAYNLTAKHREYDSFFQRLSISDNVEVNIVLSPKTNGRIKGRVVDKAKKPIAYASVRILETSIEAVTDDKGNYLIEDVPFGTYDVVCQMMGFSPVRKKNVKIKDAKQTTLNFTLERTDVQFDAFMVTKDREEIVSAQKTSSAGKDDKEESRTHPEIIARDPSGSAKEPTKPGDKDYSKAPILEKERTKDESIEYSEAPMLLETYSSGGSASSPSAPRQRPTQSGLRAGYSDDNKQFNYYLHFLERFRQQARHIPIRVEERFLITCYDEKEKTIPNADIQILDKHNQLIDSGKTMADGTFLFFPAADIDEFFIEATYGRSSKKIHHTIDMPHRIEIQFEQTSKKVAHPAPLDILFILDTTGSMGEEIHRLKQTMELIALNVESFSPKPDLRLGMVLYKDKHDVYVTKVIPFTSDITEFQQELDKVEASGGGDYPEDLQSALYDAMKNVEWNENGIRLAFIITDAPPHLDYGQEYTYYEAAKEAKQKAIKIFSVGTGGLDVNGEYVLRQLSQYTSACYVFLTYGETGESAGGRPGSVSHHTGENFQTDKLESIIIHFVREELRAYNDMEIELTDEYFTAEKRDDEEAKETLELLFERAFNQLADYSSIRLEPHILTAIAPLVADRNFMKANAEYFYDHMLISLAKNPTFRATERRDLQPILDELKFQLDALADEENAARLGKFLGAKLLIATSIYERDNVYELILKLMNVETVEVLSVTKLRIDKKLGL